MSIDKGKINKEEIRIEIKIILKGIKHMNLVINKELMGKSLRRGIYKIKGNLGKRIKSKRKLRMKQLIKRQHFHKKRNWLLKEGVFHIKN